MMSNASEATLVIRPATITDAVRIAEIYNEAILTTTATFDIEPKTVAERTDWLHAHGQRVPVLAAEVDGIVVGFASLSPWSDREAYAITAETGFYVHSSHRGRGVGRRLNAAIINEAKRHGFHSLIARVTADSVVSIHLNKQAGFVVIGTMKQVGCKFGRLLDVLIMQKLLD